MTIDSTFWILQKQDSGRLLQETLERTRIAALTAGSNALDVTIEDLKANGWKAIKVTLNYA